MIFLDGRAKLVLERDGLEFEHEGARVGGLVARRAFPFSGPSAHIALMAGDETRAMIDDPAALDAESRAALERALADHRFLPAIQRVEALTFERNLYAWTVVTDRGPRAFRTRHGWGEEPVVRAADGQLVVTATDGVRYRIPDPSALPEAERRLLATLL